MKKFRNSQGFTLIEIITVILFMAIITVVTGMGIVRILEGRVFLKINAGTIQKGQVAMARIAKELNSVNHVSSNTWTYISAGSQNSVTFTTQDGTTYSISLTGSNVQVNQVTPSTFNDVLVDNVNSLTFRYYTAYNDPSPATTYSSSTRIVEISLRLIGADNANLEFLDRVTL
jgi:hypothetical protein